MRQLYRRVLKLNLALKISSAIYSQNLARNIATKMHFEDLRLLQIDVSAHLSVEELFE